MEERTQKTELNIEEKGIDLVQEMGTAQSQANRKANDKLTDKRREPWTLRSCHRHLQEWSAALSKLLQTHTTHTPHMELWSASSVANSQKEDATTYMHDGGGLASFWVCVECYCKISNTCYYTDRKSISM